MNAKRMRKKPNGSPNISAAANAGGVGAQVRQVSSGEHPMLTFLAALTTVEERQRWP